jgi:FkbM family methyltransferase
VLGGRPLARIVKEIGRPRNYLALARMFRVCRDPLDVARRYFLGGGTYPHRCELRTPVGGVSATVYSHHDVWTVVEVFCRGDYRVGREIEVAVDVGSNIGISALYFLTRNSACRTYLYEPDPRNAERLRRNLEAFSDRWTLHEAAVGPTAGSVEFGREETGRYGAVGAQTEDVIRVECVAVNDLLEDILSREGAVDVLKVDTEGLETATIAAISPELLEGIRTIYFESESPARLHEEHFEFSYANETVRLNRKPGPDALTES